MDKSRILHGLSRRKVDTSQLGPQYNIEACHVIMQKVTHNAIAHAIIRDTFIFIFMQAPAAAADHIVFSLRHPPAGYVTKIFHMPSHILLANLLFHYSSSKLESKY